MSGASLVLLRGSAPVKREAREGCSLQVFCPLWVVFPLLIFQRDSPERSPASFSKDLPCVGSGFPHVPLISDR